MADKRKLRPISRETAKKLKRFQEGKTGLVGLMNTIIGTYMAFPKGDPVKETEKVRKKIIKKTKSYRGGK